MKWGFFETFLYVEQQFIPKKFVASWSSEGWQNQARPNLQNCPNWADFGGLAVPGYVSHLKAMKTPTFYM